MATTKKVIGKIPVYKGEWTQGAYSRLNQVSLLGSTFQSNKDNNTSKPADIVDGKLVVDVNWDIISNGTDAFLANNKIAQLETKTADLNNDMYGSQGSQTIYDISFENGGLVGGNPSVLPNRIRTSSINTTGLIYISLADGFEYSVVEYSGSTFLSNSPWGIAPEFNVTGDRVRFVIRKKDGTNIDTSIVPSLNMAVTKIDMPADGIIQRLSRFEKKTSTKYLHFSIDDITACFEDIISNQSAYSSIFNNTTFAWLKSLNDRWDVVITLYPDRVEILENIPGKYAEDFRNNAHWLKIGFQALANKDYRLITDKAVATADYERLVNKMYTLTGTSSIIDRVIRGNFFHGSRECCEAWRDAKCGIIGVLGCDDWGYNSGARIQNYYLSDDQSKFVDKHEKIFDATTNLWIFKTDFRFEQVMQRWGNIDNCIAYYSSLDAVNQSDELICFTHENLISSHKSNVEKFINWARNTGYVFDYPANRVSHI